VTRVGLWLRVARAPYGVLAVVPILVGTAYAMYEAYELAARRCSSGP
jgi:1,4-dihydroxy-2-naphthoate octaprenyltransferase